MDGDEGVQNNYFVSFNPATSCFLSVCSANQTKEAVAYAMEHFAQSEKRAKNHTQGFLQQRWRC